MMISRIFLSGSASAATGALLLILESSGCVEIPSEPVLPTYDIQASIPLLDRRFTVADFRGKDQSLSATPDGGLEYTSSEIFDPIGYGSFTVRPKASSQQVELGTFQVAEPVIPPLSFDYSDLTGGASPPPPAPFPATSFIIPERPIGPLTGFEYIEFEAGTISLTIRNTLPVPVTLPNPVVLRNNKTTAPTDLNQIASFIFSGQITGGGEQTQTASLSGVTVQSLLMLPATDASTPGSGMQPVTISPSDGLIIEVTINNALARAARATIPSQNVLSVADSSFVVDDSVTIQQAFFRSGSFSILIENNIDVQMTMSIRLDELKDRFTSAPFEINPQFSGKGSRSIPVDMRFYKIETGLDSIGTTATFSAGISTISNQDSSREVRSADFVRVSIVPGPLLFIEQVTGRIKPRVIQVQTGAPGFSLGEAAKKFEGEFSLDSLEIALELSSSSGFPTDYDAWFVGINRRSRPAKSDSIKVPPPIGSVQTRFFPANNQTTKILLDNTTGLNTFFSKFFPNLPDTFIVRGTMTVNPPDVYASPAGIQTVYDTSTISSSVDMKFPVRVGIRNAVVRDSVALDTRERFPKDIAESSESGTLYFEVENGLPLDIAFRAFLVGNDLGGDRDTLLLIPKDGPRRVTSAAVDAGGSVTFPTTNRFSFTLLGDDLSHFENSDAMLIQLDVESAGGGSIVRVRNTDSVRIRASGNVVYTVNKP